MLACHANGVPGRRGFTIQNPNPRKLFLRDKGDIESGIVGPLLFGGHEVTHYELYENGSSVATITGNFSGAKYYSNTTMSTENGYTFADNGTVYNPQGEEIKIVFGE